MPGPCGTSANRPLIDSGTLCRSPSAAPGPTQSSREAFHSASPSLSELWDRYRKVEDWLERIENYARPEKRDEQIARDAADLPFKFLEALGVELKMIPLVPLWKAELEILVRIYLGVSRAGARAAGAKQQWDEALKISEALAPQAQDAARTLTVPDQYSEVGKWNAIVRWRAKHQPLTGGIFMGLGFTFRVSSVGELNAIASSCQAAIVSHAAGVALGYLTLHMQEALITNLARESQTTFDAMKESKDTMARLVAAARDFEISANDRAADREPLQGVTNAMQALHENTLAWLAAARAALNGAEI
jgi:hypothetical protein